MAGYKELEIYKEAFRLAILIHPLSLKLPAYELYEQGSQLRRSTKSIKDQIAEGYGRRRYKADFVKFLVYAQASCDEALNQIETIQILHANITEFSPMSEQFEILGKRINKYIQYVEKNWNQPRTQNPEPNNQD